MTKRLRAHLHSQHIRTALALWLCIMDKYDALAAMDRCMNGGSRVCGREQTRKEKKNTHKFSGVNYHLMLDRNLICDEGKNSETDKVKALLKRLAALTCTEDSSTHH